MKRKFKRIASLILAAVMVFAMAMPAMAVENQDGPFTITINASETDTAGNHTYKAYQIFKGTLSGTMGDDGIVENEVLSDITWGEDITDAGQKALLEKFKDREIEGDETVTDLPSLLKYLTKNKGTEDALAREITELLESNPAYLVGSEGAIDIPYDKDSKTYVSGEVAAGYYLIADESDPARVDSITRYIIQVVNNVVMNPKSAVPSVEKKVQDVNDSRTGVDADGNWKDSADYDIGDKVPFQLTGTVAEDYAEYDEYTFTFHDVQSSGLSFIENSVVVKIGEIELTKDEDYDIVTEELGDGCTFEIKIHDMKKLTKIIVKAGDKVVVEYKSELLSTAVIGNGGNPNEVKLEYSNNPNPEGKGKTGTTPPDKVVVFTYETDIDKVDEAGDPLTGAVFTLYKWMLETPPMGYETNEHTPTTQPGGEELTTPGTPGYWKELSAKEVTGTTTEFEFEGLDDGIYKLVETVTPPGRNTAPDIDFEITAEHDDLSDTPELKRFTINTSSLTAGGEDGKTPKTVTKTKGTETVNPGFVYGEVINKEGTQLPETGGIGTTIFYVVGSVLVLGAVILLVTKRRMKSE